MDKSERNRKRGALIGLAVGDALGAAVEFMPPGSFMPVTGYRDGGPHRLVPGQWTDDTSLALAIADSIAEVGWDLDDQARRYFQWWQDGKYSVNDVDTTAAVCGQLTGAYWGESGIPSEWREGLAQKGLIESALDGIVAEDR